MNNSTISSNTALDAGSGLLATGRSGSRLESATIAYNIGAGAQLAVSSEHTLTVDSVIVDNPGGGGTNCWGGNRIGSCGHNLDSGNTCNFVATTP